VNPDLQNRPPLETAGAFSNPETAMPEITSLFVTRLYRAKLNDLAKKKVDYAELRHDLRHAVAEDDEAGQEWCEENGYPGYTSYASLG
jgi:hypothetical protein